MTDMRRGLLSRAYLAASHGIPLIAPMLLRRRLKRGKENPDRWREKLGERLAPRPQGPLIWLHAVGLGEVMSLRGLITRLAAHHPTANFLVTSSTAASAAVFLKNLPPRTTHQFLPIDAPTYRRKFLDHFQPDLCVWTEQDVWPGFVSDIAKYDIPQIIIAARMGAKSFAAHKRARPLYRDLYRTMALITAQDTDTAAHLKALGARSVTITGSLKPSAPALGYDPQELARVQSALAGRTVWTVAPSHPEDEALAIAAHDALRKSDPRALLIVAPRYPDRRQEITAACAPAPPLRSDGAIPGPTEAIWLCDTFGDLGLVYRLSALVLIGGTFCDVEGHNPWEAANLQTAIAHGPRIANFASDYATLHNANAAIKVASATELVEILQSPKLQTLTDNATKLIATASQQTDDLAGTLLRLLKTADG